MAHWWLIGVTIRSLNAGQISVKYLISDTFRHSTLTAFQTSVMRAIELFLKFVGRLPEELLDTTPRYGFDCRVIQPDAVSCGFILVWKLLNFARSGDLEQVRNASTICFIWANVFS